MKAHFVAKTLKLLWVSRGVLFVSVMGSQVDRTAASLEGKRNSGELQGSIQMSLLKSDICHSGLTVQIWPQSYGRPEKMRKPSLPHAWGGGGNRMAEHHRTATATEKWSIQEREKNHPKGWGSGVSYAQPCRGICQYLLHLATNKWLEHMNFWCPGSVGESKFNGLSKRERWRSENRTKKNFRNVAAKERLGQ